MENVRYMIEEVDLDRGKIISIARCKNDYQYALWRNIDCKWHDDSEKLGLVAMDAFFGYETGFHTISEEKALEIIAMFEKK